MLPKTHRLIEQQIARYFSRLSTVTKIGLLMRSPSVNMNEEEEADANDLASEVETDRLFFHMYCLCSRKRLCLGILSREICRKPTGQILLAHF